MADLYVSESEERESRSLNPLSAYVAHPSRAHFATQEEKEKIILLLRKHWITNLSWFFLAIICFFAPLALRVFPIIEFLPERYQLMSVIMWYLLLTAFIFEKFLTWFFNVYLVTDERLVDVDFYNLIYKQITEAKIDKIQDITFRVGGVVRSLFNYGDVLVQTAGAEPNLEFEAVPNPEKVVKVLQALRTQEEIEALQGRIR